MGRLNRIDVRGPDDCWPWTGPRLPKGYGRVYIDGRDSYVHRVVWEEENGPIPDGMLVCHTCDNPPCCNPAHLFLGTNADNLADMRAKGRAAPLPPRPGERNPAAKLTEADVQRIRDLCGRQSQASVAREFGVSTSLVSKIVKRQAWAHV